MRRFFTAVIAGVLVLSMLGCPSVQNKKPESPAPAKAEPQGSYGEFEDVYIPREMELDKDKSFVFETPQFKTGILVYAGRVDSVSLANFLEKNMTKDNWKLRSKMKYNRTIIVFEKPDRDCIINIIDETFKTYLEVMVAPRMDIPAEPARNGNPSAVETAPLVEPLKD